MCSVPGLIFCDRLSIRYVNISGKFGLGTRQYLARIAWILTPSLFLYMQVWFLVAKLYTQILSGYRCLAFISTSLQLQRHGCVLIATKIFSLLSTSSTSEPQSCFVPVKQRQLQPSVIDYPQSALLSGKVFNLGALMWHRQSVFWWYLSFYLR